MAANDKKTHLVYMTESEKAVLEKAAVLERRPLTGFLVYSALERAREKYNLVPEETTDNGKE
jgi:uncharacterized protein (DUF1778 family)